MSTFKDRFHSLALARKACGQEFYEAEKAFNKAKEKYESSKTYFKNRWLEIDNKFTRPILDYVVKNGEATGKNSFGETMYILYIDDCPTFTRPNGSSYTFVSVRVYSSNGTPRLSWDYSDKGYFNYKDEEPLYNCDGFEEWACKKFELSLEDAEESFVDE